MPERCAQMLLLVLEVYYGSVRMVRYDAVLSVRVGLFDVSMHLTCRVNLVNIFVGHVKYDLRPILYWLLLYCMTISCYMLVTYPILSCKGVIVLILTFAVGNCLKI